MTATLASGSLFQTLSRHFPGDAAQPFLITPTQTWSYGDLIAASAKTARALASLGVKPGERVAVQVEKSAQALMLFFGVNRLGAVYLPLNTAYTTAEVSYFLSDAEPALVVVDPARAEAIAAVAGQARVLTLDTQGHGSLWDAVAAADDAPCDIFCNGDDLAAILYTSGTTGRSKGAMLSHRNLASNAATLVDYWRFTSSDVLLHALPIFHTHGLFVATNIIAMAGASMIFLPKFDIDEIMRTLPQATTMMGVPTFYSRLLAHPNFSRATVAHMRLLISGSAPLSAEVHKEFTARTGHKILERYGMTETNMNTSNPYDGDRIPGSVGLPLPGISVRVADPESGRVLGVGEIGVVEIKGPNVFMGYWRQPEKTAAEFRADGYFISGDLGYFDDQGYLYLVGRGKDLIITGGFNVYPAEIETALDALPEISESAVIGLPHQDFGEAVTAVVVAKGVIDETKIQHTLGETLAKFKVPKRVLVLDELPRNAMGKIQKNALRERYKSLYEC